MPIRFSALGRVFAPSWPMTLLTLVLLTLFVSLGRWQWQRGEARQVQWQQFEQAPTPVLSATAPDFDSLPRFSRVAFAARLQPAHQFLLDNRTHAGKPGYEVLTPALLDNGERILVNRGWVPFSGFRDRLPDISLPATGFQTLVGRLDDLPSAGLASGRAPPDTSAQWPKVTSFPAPEELERVLGEKLSRKVLLLDPGIPGYGDFVRDWSPPGLAPARHFSYAIQWWGFAVVLLVLYFGLNFRKVS
jgi:surfeit locus 1 family protein